jgi:hypothetical protein
VGVREDAARRPSGGVKSERAHQGWVVGSMRQDPGGVQHKVRRRRWRRACRRGGGGRETSKAKQEKLRVR